MQGILYYCVLKNYSGLFRKKFRGNTHLFFIPLDNGIYGYFGLIGEMIDKKEGLPEGFEQYACKLILKLPEDVVKTVIDHQIEYFKGRLQIIEEVQVSVKKIGEGQYFIDTNRGNFIKSDLVVKYQLEYSSSDKRIYTIDGNLDFMSTEISSPKQLKSDLMKQSSVMTKLSKLKEEEEIDIPLLAECCRAVLIDEAYKRFNLDKFSKVCEHLDNKNDEEIINRVFKQNILREDRPAVEPYSRAGAKYGIASSAGLALAPAVAFSAKHLTKLSMSPFGPMAGLIGGGIAAAAFYLYRRLTNPCRKKVEHLHFGKRKMAFHQCKADAARKVINKLVDGMNDCRHAKDPERCLEKMQKNIDRWKQVYQDEIIKAKRSIYSED
jgi:hypothetical protein